MIALVIALLLAWPLTADAVTRYMVSGGYTVGPDSYTRGVATSCQGSDFTTTVTASSTGDTVVVGPGTCYWSNLDNQSKAIKIRGSGAYPLKGAATSGGTRIHVNGGSYILALGESTSGSNGELFNITFVREVTDTPVTGDDVMLTIVGNAVQSSHQAGDGLLVVHHITWQCHQTSATFFRIYSGRAVIYRSRFECDPATGPGYTNAVANLRSYYNNPAVYAAAIASTPTYGTANAADMIYFEDNIVKNMMQANDVFNGVKLVDRYNQYLGSAVVYHGHDSGVAGPRHAEVYNNTFTCSSANPLNATAWQVWRSGTGVVTDNTFDVLTHGAGNCLPTFSVDGGTLALVLLTLVQVAEGNCVHPKYPFFLQHGWGFDGTSTLDANGQNQQLEPIYFWNNTTTGGAAAASPAAFNTGVDMCGQLQDTSDFVQLNREYYLSAKPGYTKGTYPHALATAQTAEVLPALPNGRLGTNFPKSQ